MRRVERSSASPGELREAPPWPGAACEACCQNWARASRPPEAPPLAMPELKITALMAPALAPLTASKETSFSSSRRSRTPQVKAPKRPTPLQSERETKALARPLRRSAGAPLLRLFAAGGAASRASVPTTCFRMGDMRARSAPPSFCDLCIAASYRRSCCVAKRQAKIDNWWKKASKNPPYARER